MSPLAEIEQAVPSLRRYALSLLRHGPDADDLVQDSLVRALDRLPQRDASGPLRPWLFAIMHNLFVSRWRRIRRWQRVLAPDADPTLAADPPRQDWRLVHRDLLRGLDRLPLPQRQVLLLVTVEGLEYREVAGVLGIPIGTVMSRLSRARDALRGHLGEEPVRRTDAIPLRRVK